MVVLPTPPLPIVMITPEPPSSSASISSARGALGDLQSRIPGLRRGGAARVEDRDERLHAERREAVKRHLHLLERGEGMTGHRLRLTLGEASRRATAVKPRSRSEVPVR